MFGTPDYIPASVLATVRTPCHVVSADAVERNCRILEGVKREAGCRILLAQKAFALPAMYPLIARYLDGVCASGPVEARMGREDFGREVHTYSPAYSNESIRTVAAFSDVVIFNSLAQWRRFREVVAAAGRPIGVGLRVNPGHSEVATDLYNPCLPGSRFGLSAEDLEGETLDGIDGLHFHALCEQGADVLARVLESFVRRFSPWIGRMKWVNFGGGHHITKPGYDIALLVSTIRAFKARFPGVTVYLEPGEAVVYDAGVFVTSVLDVVKNGMDVAILDSSAETQLPDILAMPYRPKIYGAGQPGELAHTYRLGGVSCLAGDIFGDFSFARPLEHGDRLIISDAALYSFVKSTTFNGVELPSIYVTEGDGSVRPVWQFDYEDYKGRLAR